MKTIENKAHLMLLLGDASILYLSVWITLFLRHFKFPDINLAIAHLTSFSFLFLVWFITYFLSGLYNRNTVLFKKQLPKILFIAQAINVGLAALLFFLIPFFQITPKTILMIYLFVSTAFLYIWRVYIYPNIFLNREIGAMLIGTSVELAELAQEVNGDSLYPLKFKSIIRPELCSDEEVKRTIKVLLDSGSITTIVADVNNCSLDNIFNFIYQNTFIEHRGAFIDARHLYQEVFERIPLSLIDDRWLLHNISITKYSIYSFLKRVLDIVASIFFGTIALIITPIIYIAIKIEDGGSVIIRQRRIGKNAKEVILYKFRSMTHTDDGKWINENGSNGENKITKVGSFIRRTRIDELPQLFNVLKGDISLVGPRPDIIGLYDELLAKVPFYNLRYSVTPGITGWAQTVQRYNKGVISPQSIEETRVRLQYDLYYIKNRSLFFDLKIIMRTFRVMLTK